MFLHQLPSYFIYLKLIYQLKVNETAHPLYINLTHAIFFQHAIDFNVPSNSS